jgi:hypothetical protein
LAKWIASISTVKAAICVFVEILDCMGLAALIGWPLSPNTVYGRNR